MVPMANSDTKENTDFLSEKSLKGYIHLHQSCAVGDLEKVTEILENKEDLRINDVQEGVTALHLATAIQNDHTYFIVEILLNNDAEVNQKNQPEMDTPLILTVRHLDPPDIEDVVLLLLKQKADVGCRNMHLRNAYDIALERGFYKLSTLLDDEWTLEEAIDFYKERNSKLFGERLIAAIQEGSFEKSKMCIQRGANVNYVKEVNVESGPLDGRDGVKYVRKQGAGPIHYAITHYSEDKEKLLRLLKNNHLNVNLTDYEGDTALNLVIKQKHLRVDEVQYRLAEILLDWGTDPTYKDLDGKDATDLAEERQYDDILELLGRTRFNIYEWVLSRSIEDIRKELEKKKCEQLNAPNDTGLYPIHLATGGREGDIDDTIACIGLLLEFGADIDAQTKGKHTALHIACEANEKEIVEYLILKGANTELRNDEGLTALEMAKKLNFHDLALFLENTKAKKEVIDAMTKKNKRSKWCSIQ